MRRCLRRRTLSERPAGAFSTRGGVEHSGLLRACRQQRREQRPAVSSKEGGAERVAAATWLSRHVATPPRGKPAGLSNSAWIPRSEGPVATSPPAGD